jgi:predicted nucleic acid-binding protein
MLLDTSGLMCLFDQRDMRHATATRHYDSAVQRLTHNYILAEFVALAIARRVPLTKALRFIEAIQHGIAIEVRWIDMGLHDRAMKLLSERPDKRWTLCDAASFSLMADNNITAALTTDHNFEQAGFTRLLNS